MTIAALHPAGARTEAQEVTPSTAAAGLDLDRERALVAEHLPIVGYLVSEFLTRVPGHVQRDDLVSAGLAALAQAARSFDSSLGVPFSRFANTRIRGGILDELRSYDWASRGVRSRARQLGEVEDELTARLGRRAKISEVAEAMGTDVEHVHDIRDAVQRAMVLSIQGLDEAGGSVEDRLSAHVPGPEEELLHAERLEYLRAAVAALPERLRTVVSGYFLQERPMAQIAAELGVSESRVSQLRAEALSLLHEGMTAHLDRVDTSGAASSASGSPSGVVARRRQAYVAAVATQADFRARLALGGAVRAGAEGVVPAQRTAERVTA